MKRAGVLFVLIVFLSSSVFLFSQERRVNVVKRKTSEKRIALVIGNSAYKNSPLKDTVNDAVDMADLLEKCGFKVTLRTDASLRVMKQVVRRFGEALKSGGVGLFYYAGHGMQVEGRNYLIPLDADVQAEDEVEFNALDVGFVLNKMEKAGNAMNIVILDACRDNPFARSFRSSSRGLARMDAPKGSLIAYATGPGKTAAEGKGRNGIFTKHLITKINNTNLEIGRLFRKVRKEVMEETSGRQVPWESVSLVGDFYFFKPNIPLKNEAVELEFWKSIKNSNNPGDFKSYLGKFPNGIFAGIANNRLKELEQQSNISSVPKFIYKTLSSSDVKFMLKRKGFFESDWNKSGKFKNKYKMIESGGDKVVVDLATGLMWYHLGSSDSMTFESAKKWINDLNIGDFAGYHDWRLPTLEEGASLLESSKQNADLYIAPLFSPNLLYIWVGNKSDSGAVWGVSFLDGNVFDLSVLRKKRYVLPVRPVK